MRTRRWMPRQGYNGAMTQADLPEDENALEESAMAAYEPLPAIPLLDDDSSDQPFDSEPIVEERKRWVSLPRPTEPDTARLSRLREKAKGLPTAQAYT